MSWFYWELDGVWVVRADGELGGEDGDYEFKGGLEMVSEEVDWKIRMLWRCGFWRIGDGVV